MDGSDFDQVLRSVAQQVMVKIAQNSREQDFPPGNKGYTIKQFTRMNPPAFSGSVNPIIVENWLAVKLLEDQRPVPTTLTWNLLKEIFFDRYFPTYTRVVKMEEFPNLTQRPLTVQQYVAKFVELSRFAPYMIPDELRKAQKFNRGLR
ncbi:uncharacterized protein LOC131158616 [Malania oleifera]|uniref:uncharacterized protein LOC131158616 n=1 Tax=Malania oleifera TaxID=397392 RepID=UPI0025AE6903|nr:uncharacterized protein LOC131158616 [Malania oleifera]